MTPRSRALIPLVASCLIFAVACAGPGAPPPAPAEPSGPPPVASVPTPAATAQVADPPVPTAPNGPEVPESSRQNVQVAEQGFSAYRLPNSQGVTTSYGSCCATPTRRPGSPRLSSCA